MTEIQLLLELQHLDMQIRQLEKALVELPVRKEIKGLEAALETLRASLSDMSARLARIRKEQKEAEWNLKETIQAIESISGKLYGGAVTNPREIEGMQGKLRVLEGSKAQLEECIIAHMEEAEAVESRLESLGREVGETASKLDVLNSACAAKVSEMEAEISDARMRRKSVASKISPSTLARYEQLVKEKGGLAVVPVKEGICGGCHVVLPTFIVARCRPNDTVVKCESCGRILCWTE